MKRFINYFFFTRRERLGSVVLLLLCTGIFSVPTFLETFAKHPSTDFSPFEQLLGAFRSEARTATPVADTLFYFDPNLAAGPDLVRLGLSEKIARNICHYREKGGKFRKPEDFKKIWGLSEADFTRLRPMIRIAGEAPLSAHGEASFEKESGKYKRDTTYPEKARENYFRKKIPSIVDLNNATAEALNSLPMIGEKRAAQILHFREKLGGFGSVEQLAEMYNLPDSVFQAIRPFLKVESPVYHKLNINTASAEDLDAHPYISGKQAALIVAYREQHGPYGSVDDLLKIRAFSNDDWWKKARPYLGVE